MYWNYYHEAYVGEFDSLPRNGTSERYKLTIYSKSPSILLGLKFGPNPVVLRYLEDNAFPSIKGSELEVNLLNYEGTMPSSTFYSNNEDQFKCKFECNGITLFVGFLVQKDISEIQVDFTHEFKLVFTDGLGLLRDIPFNDACKMVPKTGGLNITAISTRLNSFAETSSFYPYLDVTSLAGSPAIDDTVIIEKADRINGVYRITRKNDPPHNPTLPFVNRILQVAEPINDYTVSRPQANLYYFTPHKTNDITSVKDIIKICLAMTGTNLSFSIGYNVTSPLVPVSDLFSNVYLDLDSFRRGETWLSCYEVLESIMKSFRFTIMQSGGYFRLIRWFDLKDNGNLLTGQSFTYPSYNLTGTNQLIATKSIGDGTDIEYGLNRTLERPLKFSQQTFEIQPFENCPKNYNLQKLGSQLSIVTTGTEIKREFNLADWSFNPAAPAAQSTIVSRSDIYGNEFDRYLRIQRLPGQNGGSYESVQSLPIWVNKTDEFTFEFKFNPFGWQKGDDQIKIRGYVGIKHTSYSSGQETWLGNWDNDDKRPYWTADPAIKANWWYEIRNAEDDEPENRYNQVLITARMPWADGYLTVYLFNLVDEFPGIDDLTTEFRFKDIKLTIKPFISGSNLMAKKNIRSYQWQSISNSKTETVLNDTSNKIDVKGVFKYATAGRYEGIDRWALFSYQSNLAQIMTRQDVIKNKRTRLKFEGKTFPVVMGGQFLYPHTLISLQFILDKWFVFGKLELNFKENDANFTLFELYDIAEVTNEGVIDQDVQSVINYESR